MFVSYRGSNTANKALQMFFSPKGKLNKMTHRWTDRDRQLRQLRQTDKTDTRQSDRKTD